MTEVSGVEEESILTRSTTRRNLILGAFAAAAAFVLGKELTKPNIFQEEAKKLWDEYKRNPIEFKKRYPGFIRENLIAGSEGVNLRDFPSAATGREGVVGYLKPNTEIGTALVIPSQKPTQDGIFLSIQRDNRIHFIAEGKTTQKPSNP